MRFLLLFLGACAATPVRPTARAPLEVTYLGTAGWQIRAGETVLLIDPYYSRLGDPDDGDRIAPDESAIAAHAPPHAKVVLVTHSHWDHLLDAARVAARTGAALLGSESTASYGHASGLPDAQIIPVRGGEDYAFDGFSVKVIPSLHSALHEKHWLDTAIIPRDVRLPMTVADFHPGATFAFLIRIGGRELLFVNSANFIERELAGLRPDVAFVAPGLRGEIHDYTCRLLGAVGRPRLVFLTHFDDYSVPYEKALSGYGATLEKQRDFVSEVKACAPGTEVRVPRHLEPVALP